jgi:hypothetical protein
VSGELFHRALDGREVFVKRDALRHFRHRNKSFY